MNRLRCWKNCIPSRKIQERGRWMEMKELKGKYSQQCSQNRIWVQDWSRDGGKEWYRIGL